MKKLIPVFSVFLLLLLITPANGFIPAAGTIEVPNNILISRTPTSSDIKKTVDIKFTIPESTDELNVHTFSYTVVYTLNYYSVAFEAWQFHTDSYAVAVEEDETKFEYSVNVVDTIGAVVDNPDYEEMWDGYSGDTDIISISIFVTMFYKYDYADLQEVIIDAVREFTAETVIILFDNPSEKLLYNVEAHYTTIGIAVLSLILIIITWKAIKKSKY